jgi:hypothetical protein
VRLGNHEILMCVVSRECLTFGWHLSECQAFSVMRTILFELIHLYLCFPSFSFWLQPCEAKWIQLIASRVPTQCYVLSSQFLSTGSFQYIIWVAWLSLRIGFRYCTVTVWYDDVRHRVTCVMGDLGFIRIFWICMACHVIMKVNEM